MVFTPTQAAFNAKGIAIHNIIFFLFFLMQKYENCLLWFMHSYLMY